MKDFRTVYKNLAQTKNLESHHVVQLAILKAMDYTDDNATAIKIIKQILHRAFTPVTRKNALDNGATPFGARDKAIRLTNVWKPVQYAEYLSEPELVRYHRLSGLLVNDLKEAERAIHNRYYVYIFVRQDLSPEYQLVQAAHAAAKMGHRSALLPKQTFDELYFAVIGVPNIAGLATAIGDCQSLGIAVHPFYEPDIGGQMTAIASNPIPAIKRKRLLSYKKLLFSNTVS